MTAARVLRNDPLLEAARDAAPAGVRAELVDGALLMAPAPVLAHQNASAELTALLRTAPKLRWRRGDTTQPPTGWRIVPVPELHLGAMPDKSNPDLAGWRAEGAPKLTDNPILVVPDWVCEVLSPSTEKTDRGVKFPMFASHGVRHAWIIDVETQRLEVFLLDRGALREVARFEGDATVTAEPFAELSFELGSLWE